MRVTKDFKKFLSEMFLGIFIVTSINPAPALRASNNDGITSPLKQISKLECRFKNWWELSSNCKQDLPTLKTQDYEKYAKKDWGYNDFTRIYTVLWWSSYKYGWDVWNGWHMWTDIATSKWTPVYSIARWVVLNAKYMSSLWNNVSVEHTINGKTVVSNYSHLSKINVSEWQVVNVWQKIGEVGSTGNSTWNHLHFQIDLDTPFHPYYHDYNKCPYSYYKVTEEWLCFNELNKNTIDPLLFLETSGKVLDNIKVTKVSRKSISSSSSNTVKNNTNLDIFSKTVYVWYPTTDVKEVQKIYREMWVYKWEITWDYNDITEDIIEYQISTWVIKNRNENWAGWFGPKTRTQTKKDYKNHLAWNSNTSNQDIEVETKVETKKISRKNLLTREEIEAREVKDFLKKYNVDLNLRNVWWNIKLWETAYIDLKITDRKWKAFKWSMPWWMTFIVDNTKLQVFPQKLYYFTDGKRTIQLKGLTLWDTNLHVRIWATNIETIPIKVYNSSSTIVPESWVIVWNNKIVMWDSKTSIILLKDKNGKKLINLEYANNFKLQTSEWLKVCMKSWTIKNIKKVYNSKCRNEDYKDYVDFSYQDTVWWLVIFDYKAYGRNAKVEIINTTKNKTLSSKKIAVVNPKGLKSDYNYKTEVVQLLEEWIADWLSRWYFLEERPLKEYDALSWIRNSLIKMNEDPEFYSMKKEIENNLRAVFKKRQSTSKRKTIDREDLLVYAHDYLLLNKNTTNSRKDYKDLDETLNNKVSRVFDEKTNWKDKFGSNYFRPWEDVTRWEWTYLLAKTMEKNKQVFLTLK